MKARITVTVSRVVDLDQDFYEAHLTTTDRLAAEIAYAEDLFHEWAEGDNVEWKTTGELIDDVAVGD